MQCASVIFKIPRIVLLVNKSVVNYIRIVVMVVALLNVKTEFAGKFNICMPVFGVKE